MWGPGAVRLVELPTAEECYDNIVAYWRPQAGLKAGLPFAYAYRLSWASGTPAWHGYRVLKTRVGRGGRPDSVRQSVWRGLLRPLEQQCTPAAG